MADWNRLAMFANTPSDWSCCMGEWDELYKGINYSNQCIDNIPNVPGVSDEVRNRSIAEARFLRAYYYYRLFMNLGERVPLIVKELNGLGEDNNLAQAELEVFKHFTEKD